MGRTVEQDEANKVKGKREGQEEVERAATVERREDGKEDGRLRIK